MMLERKDLFSNAGNFRAFQNSVLPEFLVYVDDFDVTGCTMKMYLERRYNPGIVALSKNCTAGSDDEGNYFAIQLTGTDTANLSGVYNMYFVLFDANGNRYWNLDGTIEFIETPVEVS